MNCFLCDRDFRHERVNKIIKIYQQISQMNVIMYPFIEKNIGRYVSVAYYNKEDFPYFFEFN